jgi:hypothetical protein
MTKLVKGTGPAAPGTSAQEIVPGSVRQCPPYRGELARHRVITAEGADYLITTADERRLGHGYITAAYPVARGYLVMMRQPLCALESLDAAEAQRQHALLIEVMVTAGTGVVRARRRSAAWRQAERMVEHTVESAAVTLAAARGEDFPLDHLIPVTAEPMVAESAEV